MTEHSVIDAALYHSLVRQGAAALYADRNEINELNVFPIPDGDTGDNMYMTIKAGADATGVGKTLGEASSEISRGMLLGARGNSGVILSRIFAGIADGLSGKDTATVKEFASATEHGIRSAYGAVSKPVEGTILTVYREAVEYATQLVTDETTIDELIFLLREEARRSLEKTPELLPVLKEADVVDSGGAGLVSIFSGMLSALRGESMPKVENEGESKPKIDLSKFTEDSEFEFGYCTEFLLRLQTKKTDIATFDIDKFTADLTELGNSVVSFRDGTIVKAHVHTFKPYEILEYAQRYGEFLTLKIENMMLQHNETEAAKEKKRKPHKKYGVVAVAAGDGIKKTFEEMGADAVISGGQCMNPSTADFIEAFDDINADTILVFPGNGNIILTANQAGEIYKSADVRVVPCKSVGEIYVALSMLDLTSDDPDEVVGNATASLEGITCGAISQTSRDAEMFGVKVNEGDFIGYSDGKIVTDSRDRAEAICSLADKLNGAKADVVLIICGSAVDEEETERVYDELSKKYKRTEVIMIDGGQPIQDYIIVVE